MAHYRYYTICLTREIICGAGYGRLNLIGSPRVSSFDMYNGAPSDTSLQTSQILETCQSKHKLLEKCSSSQEVKILEVTCIKEMFISIIVIYTTA